LPCAGLLLNAFWSNEHFPCWRMNGNIAKIDFYITFYDDESLIGVFVLALNEVALQAADIELSFIHLENNFSISFSVLALLFFDF
jgi:hypothetical protein